MLYRELWEASSRVACSLTARGVGPNQIVGLSSERTSEMLIGMLGILRSGAAYLPLDPSYPETRIAYMLKDAAAKCVLVGSRAGKRESAGDVAFLPIVDLYGGADADPSASRGRPARGGDLAYVCYTSGSTGKPKGVTVSHGNLSFFVSSMRKAIPMDGQTVVLARTPISFDPHVVELLQSLSSGARIALMDDSNSWSVDAIVSVIEAEGVNLIQFTPSLLSVLLRKGWQPAPGTRILCGGEPLSEALKNDVLRESGVALWNVYGPTETTVWCSALEMRRQDPVRLGGALESVGLWAIDKSGRAVADGETGELHIAGPGVTAGYLGRPELTDEKFKSLITQCGVVLAYRTGDLVRQTAEGQFEYLGRSDNQVKLRGYRIELLEIESWLLHGKDLSEIAGVGSTGDVLVAYYVARAEARDGTLQERLLDHARAHLPPYMVPSRFVELEGLPLGPTLKVDRKMLAARTLEFDGSLGVDGSADSSADSAIEAAVVKAWCEVLSIDAVPEGAIFSQLGGNSLSIVDLRVRLMTQLGVDIATADLFAAGSVRAQAKLIQERRGCVMAPDMADAVSERCVSSAQGRFLSSTPREQWSLNVLDFLVDTQASLRDARASVEQLIVRHDVFTIASFSRTAADGWRQSRDKSRRAGTVREAHFQSLDNLVREAVAARGTINVVQGHMFSWLVASVEGSTYIHFTCSHLISDAISMRILLLELDALLTRKGNALPPSLPFVRWIEAHRREEAKRQRELGLARWREVCNPHVPMQYQHAGHEASRNIRILRV
ncbi:MAG: amino acid adenylation domain-containing protein, partial [Alphaproteobacteria bacterium]|nr:amino acid adenylation domain-containing protein [Alphaproteobacteria bacterium]